MEDNQINGKIEFSAPDKTTLKLDCLRLATQLNSGAPNEASVLRTGILLYGWITSTDEQEKKLIQTFLPELTKAEVA